MQKKKAISLIVLVITIIVMIILAGAIILTLNNSGIINKSSEAVFKQNAKNYQSELSLYLADKLAEDSQFDVTTVNATSTTTPSIKDIIPSIAEEDILKFKLQEGNLIYVGTDTNERSWATETNIQVKIPYEELYATEIANALYYGYINESGEYLLKDEYALTDEGGEWHTGVPEGTSIALPEGTVTLPYSTFGFTNLTNLIIPSTVTNLNLGGDFAKAYIIVDSDNTTYSSINGLLYNKEGTELLLAALYPEDILVVPAGTISIAETAFHYDCSNIIVLPSTIKTMNKAFGNGGCTSLYIESTIIEESIVYFSFDDQIYVRNAEVAAKLKSGYDGSTLPISTDYNWTAPTE